MNSHTGTAQDHSHAVLQGRYWPTSTEPPRLPDGKVDVRALCRRWDNESNNEAARLAADPPNVEPDLALGLQETS